MESFEEYTQMQTLNLLSELKENIPHTIHAYSYVKTLLEWTKKRPDMKNFLLAPLGNASDATFFLYTLSEQSDGKTRLDGTIHSLTEDGAKRLGKALMSKLRILLNENSAFLFTSLNELTRPVLESALSSSGPIRFGISKCTLYWMPHDKAACLTPRKLEGIEVKELQSEWSFHINSTWPHRFPGSERLIKNTLELNYGLGVFPNQNETNLLSWGMNWFYGGIGVVGTRKGEERKGYASLVVESLAKKMGKDGLNVHLFVVSENKDGERLFTNLGFQPLSVSFWFHDI